MANKYDYKNLQKKFLEIKKLGWVKTTKKENTNGGAGNTLEHYLGIKENNIDMPDFGNIELKTTKKTLSGTITLMTHDRGIWVMKQKDAILNYGKYIKDKNRHNLYYIHETKKPTSSGLYTKVTTNSFIIQDKVGNELINYPLDLMAETWNKKVGNLAVIKFDERRNESNIREYKFNELKLYVSDVSGSKLKKLWENNLLVMETSMHFPKSSEHQSVRNHGTKIRMKQTDFDKVFTLKRKI